MILSCGVQIPYMLVEALALLLWVCPHMFSLNLLRWPSRRWTLKDILQPILPKFFTSDFPGSLEQQRNCAFPVLVSFMVSFLRSMTFFICGSTKTPGRSLEVLKVADSLSRAVTSCFIKLSFKCSWGDITFRGFNSGSHLKLYLPTLNTFPSSAYGNVLECPCCPKGIDNTETW